jgi:site-specific recombinase XerD
MKRLFNFLEAEGIIANNPARRIKAPQPKRDKPKGIQWDDFLALLKTTEGGELRDVRDRAVILFLFDTGCRVGGLCGLRVSDLDLERRRALVMEKRDKPRLVFFKPETARALAAWLEVRPQDKGLWLFVGLSPRAKPQLTIAAVEKMLKRRGEQVGISGPVNPHAFRHGFASHYLMSGGDLASLSEILGHSDVAVTKGFYGVFTADDLQVKHEQHSPISGLGGDTNGS